MFLGEKEQRLLEIGLSCGWSPERVVEEIRKGNIIAVDDDDPEPATPVGREFRKANGMSSNQSLEAQIAEGLKGARKLLKSQKAAKKASRFQRWVERLAQAPY